MVTVVHTAKIKFQIKIQLLICDIRKILFINLFWANRLMNSHLHFTFRLKIHSNLTQTKLQVWHDTPLFCSEAALLHVPHSCISLCHATTQTQSLQHQAAYYATKYGSIVTKLFSKLLLVININTLCTLRANNHLFAKWTVNSHSVKTNMKGIFSLNLNQGNFV